MSSHRRTAFMLSVCSLSAACGDENPPQLQAAAFFEFVERNDGCVHDVDCAVAGQGCLALCGVAVNSRFAAQVDAMAREYENPPGSTVGVSCNALCGETVAACGSGGCELRESSP